MREQELVLVMEAIDEVGVLPAAKEDARMPGCPDARRGISRIQARCTKLRVMLCTLGVPIERMVISSSVLRISRLRSTPA